MSAALQEHLFQYAYPSTLEADGKHQTLRLATFTEGQDARPFFFEGELANPRLVAVLLRSLMTIVRSRFHVPAAMLSRILAESDPVVTSNDDQLRFEGFSACCGVYARVDLLCDAFEGDVSGRGTTNVDFNQPILAALARIKRNDKIALAVGADQVVLKQKAGEVVEKKIKLPMRWMRGFVEVQAVQGRMEHAHQLNAVHAFRFFRSLPSMKTHRRETFVTAAGQGLRLSQVESGGAVRVGGLERLKVLENLAKDAESMDIFTDPLTGASGWVLHYPDCRFHLIISPEVWRGFSGEGQALSSLAKRQKAALPKVRALLKWQSVVDPEEIADSANLDADVVDAALKTLGTRGLVGFDLTEQAYFHREMPFDISQVEKQQPRLVAARKLIDEDKVAIHQRTGSGCEVRVKSSDVEHRVIASYNKDDAEVTFKCTCPWYAKHGNTRGPCKHILAAQIVLEESLAESS